MRYITPSVIVRGRLGDKSKPNWHIAIMCFHSRKKSQVLVDYFEAKPLGYSMFLKVNDCDVYEASVDDKKIGIIKWCTGGGPITAAIVEELTCLGVKYIIGIGAAASITDEIDKGDIVIVSEAAVKDGTSKSYWSYENMLLPNEEVVDHFLKTGEEMNLCIKGVRGVAIDNIYRETEELISPWREEGCQVLNWEITPLYAASKACGIKSIWMGHISDKLVNYKWDNWFWNRDQIYMNCIKLCKESIIRLCD